MSVSMICFVLSALAHAVFASILIYTYWPTFGKVMDYNFKISKDFVINEKFTKQKTDGKTSFGRY